jgi:CO/xanthine dehydrogenase FAD-binding subunit
MTLWKEYYLPQNIDDALKSLASAPGPVSLVAGGTDLLLDLQQGRHAPVHTLVDVSAIQELKVLEIRQGRLFVGAAVPLNRIVASPLVAEHAQALVEAAGLIGGPQVRNTATLGGNVGHALPAADGTISLLALDAQAEIADAGGCRQVPLLELFLGPGRSTLVPGKEILVGFYLPLRASGEASAFRRVMRPQGVAIAILNMSVWVRRQEDLISEIRIGIGPAGTTPKRARSTEGILRGKPFAEQDLAQALDALLAETHFRTSPHRSTAEYRHHLAGVLLKETLSAAWDRTFSTRA